MTEVLSARQQIGTATKAQGAVEDFNVGTQLKAAREQNGNRTPTRHASGAPELNGTDSPRQVRSPRCEAFVMTGEKMLSLNPKISPCYAKMCQNQLPPTVEVLDAEQEKGSHLGGPFDDFPSLHHKVGGRRLRLQEVSSVAAGPVPGSQSAHTLDGAAAEHSSAEQIAPGTNAAESTSTLPADHVHNGVAPSHRLPNGVVPVDKDSIARFMAASCCSSSQSVPVSPLRGAEAETAGTVAESKNNARQRQGNHLSRTAHQRIASSISDRSASDVLTMSASTIPTRKETIVRIARQLFEHQEGIRIAAFLVKNDDLSLRIAHEFVALFNFAGIRIDAALRAFLSHVCLTGETAERAQLLAHFGARYHDCNPTVFHSVDEVHALACALLLLNTDLHGNASSASPSGKKMACRDFVENLAHTDFKYEPSMLKELYAAVKEQPFQYGERTASEEQQAASSSGDGKKRRETRLSRMLSSQRRPKNVQRKQSAAGSATALDLVDPEQQVDYKHGWLMKKSLYDADGKRTPFGRRRWQMFYATVRGMVLYLHQNERTFAGGAGRFATFRNCILLHHAVALPASEYTKRKNVFRLRTANLGELLFQTGEPAEVARWTDALNYVAAAFSTPALPTPVGANVQFSFYKPNLPSAPTRLSISEQLREHEQRLEDTAANLARLRSAAPPMKARGKVVYEYFYKERFLDTERERYSIYISVLREKVARTTTASSSAASTPLHGSNTVSISGNGTNASEGPDGRFSASFRRNGPNHQQPH